MGKMIRIDATSFESFMDSINHPVYVTVPHVPQQRTIDKVVRLALMEEDAQENILHLLAQRIAQQQQ